LKQLFAWLLGWLPVKVWQVTGPEGIGPWFDAPGDAVEFVQDESRYDPDNLLGERAAVIFLPAEYDAPWPVGRTIERGDWRIQSILVQRRDYAREWIGW
jgi:hypothetical protein